jgi:hypothetical protein
MVAAKIGDAGRELVRKLGMRVCGVVIPEIAEAFAVSDDVARNYILRMVGEGVLQRTGERRRRPEAVEWARGAGGYIYRATRRKEASPWASSRSSRRRRRSRGR